VDVFESKRRRQTKDDCALEKLARGFVFVAPENDEVVFEPVDGGYSVRHLG
jgi:hypothetical protein